ncbi:MAG: MarR family transcriptional regulator [Gemmatimonadales bacterium]
MATRPSRLQQEIKQTRPFRSVGQEAVLGLFKTADMLRRHFGQIVGTVCEADELTLQQYNVLRILRGAGADGLPTLEIATRMVEQAPGITRLLDRLEAKGLVARERCTEDRRRVTCRITRPGLALLAKLDERMNRSDEIFDTELSAAELKRLVGLLDRMRKVLGTL